MAVLGSSGGMGRFFARYFLSRGHSVTGFDPSRRKKRVRGLDLASSNPNAVKGTRLVLVASPIDATLRVVEEVIPHLEEGATLVEISSVKVRILSELQRMTRGRQIELLSLHPLFGPSLKRTSEMKIAVMMTKPESKEVARRFFPDARLIPMQPERHDREVALVLSLTHLVCLAYAAVVARNMSTSRFKELASPTSLLQLLLSQSVLAQDPSLYSYLDVGNPSSLEFLGAFAKEVSVLKGLLSSHDRRAFEERFREIARLHPRKEVEAASEKVYRAFESTLEYPLSGTG